MGTLDVMKRDTADSDPRFILQRIDEAGGLKVGAVLF
jgi:hypothetical protein